ncbi:hypothetical protein V6N12_058907 [Hibiscus sabdariffa]|uniref:Hexosyltransferase n=1 Tax=Hibiscus sabdariffa TaxID=183260 RepID=A0ABR2ETZ2_9ROSI
MNKYRGWQRILILSLLSFSSVENFDWLHAKYNSTLKEQKSYDPRYSSALNHLRFYLPYIFPALTKIVLFDHDVVVQRDLTEIWSLDMKGKVNAAVETCLESETSFPAMHMFMNFSDPFLAKLRLTHWFDYLLQPDCGFRKEMAYTWAGL